MKLKLHSAGQEEYLQLLREQYEQAVRAIENNSLLSDIEKAAERKMVKAEYERKVKETGASLF